MVFFSRNIWISQWLFFLLQLKPESTSSFNSALNTILVTTASLCNDKLTDNNIAVNQSKIDPNNICDTGGPPTPTHSETLDDPEQKGNNCTRFTCRFECMCIIRFIFMLWFWIRFRLAGGSPETATAGVSALHGVQLQGFYPMQLPQLTPGLSQFVNNDLTEHVRGWPAEACERQVSSRTALFNLWGTYNFMQICADAIFICLYSTVNRRTQNSGQIVKKYLKIQ